MRCVLWMEWKRHKIVVVIAELCALSHDIYFYRRLPLELGCCLFESYRPKPTPASGTENEDNTTSTLVAL